MDKQCAIQVRGMVQGVNFRHETLKKAKTLGLKGFVRNEPDGSVRIQAEGEEDKIKKLIEWCGCGPSSARISSVGAEWSDELGDYKNFIIER